MSSRFEPGQLADAQARGIQNLQDRPIAQAQRIIGVRRLQQLLERVLRQEVGQLLVLPRRPQAVGRVDADQPLPAQELEPGPDRGDAAGDRRLGVFLLVQPNRERPQMPARDLAWRRGSAPRTSCGRTRSPASDPRGRTSPCAPTHSSPAPATAGIPQEPLPFRTRSQESGVRSQESENRRWPSSPDS